MNVLRKGMNVSDRCVPGPPHGPDDLMLPILIKLIVCLPRWPSHHSISVMVPSVGGPVLVIDGIVGEARGISSLAIWKFVN